MKLNISDESINLKYISNDDLLCRTENLVQTERKIMHLVLTHILEIMNRRLYADLGFNSMYSMMIKKYGYSETSALRRIDAAKLLRAVPEVADRLKSGTLNLSQAMQFQKCLESEEKKGEAVSESRAQEILDNLKNCNGFETRMVLAQEFDMPVKIQEVVRPQKDESVRLEVTFTKEQFEELKQAKNFVSHIAHSGSWADVISTLASKLNQAKLGKKNNKARKVPQTNGFEDKDLYKTKLCKDKSTESRITAATDVGVPTLLNASLMKTPLRRAPISVHLKRKVIAEAAGCCQYQSSDGVRCGSQFQVQIDHKTPVIWQGSNSVDNLRLLCRTHNLLLARQMGLH